MDHIEIFHLSPVEVQIRFLSPDKLEKSIFLLGTAHVSEESTKQTENTINSLQPDCICVELDHQRYQNLQQKERWQNLDLFRTLKEGKGLLLLINLLLASFQKKVGRDLATKPGQEMIRAIELAAEKNIHLELVDRPVEVTLKRAWATCNASQKLKLLNSLLSSLSSEEKISEQDIENLKEAGTLDHLITEFTNYLPSIKTSLIDERDVFLARSIAAAAGNNIFVVLGAGHLRGVCLILEQIFLESGATISKRTECNDKENNTGIDTSRVASKVDGAEVSENLPDWLQKPPLAPIPQNPELLHIPAKTTVRKLIPWFIPIAAIAIMITGFFLADTDKALQGIGIWILSHSALAGLAALLFLAHPLSILVAIVSSPFTALNPTISVGLVTALTEVLLRKPQVKDIENLLELEKWWQFRQNRIWHALILLITVSMGGAIATFIALPWLSVLFSS